MESKTGTRNRILTTVTSETEFRLLEIGYGLHAFRSVTEFRKRSSVGRAERKWRDEKQGIVDAENLELMLGDEDFEATSRLVMLPDHVLDELGKKPFHEVLMNSQSNARSEIVPQGLAWDMLSKGKMQTRNVLEVRGYDHTLRRPDGSIIRCAEEADRSGFIGGSDDEYPDLFELAERYAQRDDVFFRSENTRGNVDRHTLPATPESLRELAAEPPYWEQKEDNLPSGIRKINVLWRPSQEDYEAVFEFSDRCRVGPFHTAWLTLVETGPRLQEKPAAERIAERLEEKAERRSTPTP